MLYKQKSTLERIFGSRSESAVEALIKSEPVQSLLTSIDDAEVARRAALVNELEALPAKHEKVGTAATKATERARQALAEAQAALNTAQQAYSEALCHSYAVSHTYETERTRLVRDLETSADPRIARFGIALDSLYNQARHALPDLVHEKSGIRADATKGQAACNALMAASREVRGMLLLSLTTEQVTAKLRQIANDLEGTLGAVSLKAPATDAGEIHTVH
jgi:hypothetical protein